MIDETAARRAVVVVGGSRGIGKAIAKVAASEGRPVVLVARSLDHLAEAASEIRMAGGEAFILDLDLCLAGAAARVEEFLTEKGLLCDVLVNSAGYGLRGAASVMQIDKQIGIIDVNIRALSELTLHFLPGMLRRRQGGVINLASVASFLPGPNMAMYYASKNFVRSFSEALNAELRFTGVTVTCAAPGPVATEFLDHSGAGKVSLFKILPRYPAPYVAEHVWHGFKSGRRLVIPGFWAKIAAATARMLPTGFLLFVVGRLQRRSSDLCPCGSGLRYKACCRATYSANGRKSGTG